MKIKNAPGSCFQKVRFGASGTLFRAEVPLIRAIHIYLLESAYVNSKVSATGPQEMYAGVIDV